MTAKSHSNGVTWGACEPSWKQVTGDTIFLSIHLYHLSLSRDIRFRLYLLVALWVFLFFRHSFSYPTWLTPHFGTSYSAYTDMPPYNKTLSALRKNKLICLCGEFRLPSDGSVVNLRNRLKDYLNLHRDTLYRNPRYKPLFPKHRKPIRQRQLPDAPSPIPSSPNSSQRSHSRSSSRSYDSWHGIADGSADSQDGDDLHENPLLFPPQSPHRIHNPQLQQILQQPSDFQSFPVDPHANYLPAPLNNIANSQRGSMPPVAQQVDGCKYSFRCNLDIIHSPSSLSLWDFFLPDTMKSIFLLLWHYAAFFLPFTTLWSRLRHYAVSRHYEVFYGHYAVLGAPYGVATSLVQKKKKKKKKKFFPSLLV